MLVRAIMLQKKNIDTLQVTNTIRESIDLLEKKDHLSVPVLDGDVFVGLLSRGYVYETFFKSGATDAEAFFQKQVGEFIKTKIPSVPETIPVEEAANIFLNSNLRFLPVTKPTGELLGIVTHKNLFSDYQKIFGLRLPKIIIHSNDFKGVLAKVTTIIAKKDGNIKNLVQKDTEIMGIQELTIRVDCPDIEKIVSALREGGIQVRYFAES